MSPGDGQGGLPRLCVYVLGFMTAYQTGYALTSVYLRSLGLSPFWIGMLLSNVMGLAVLLATPAGGLVDRIGARPVLLASAVLAAAAFLLLWLRPGIVLTMLALSLVNVANTAMTVGFQAHLRVLGGPEELQRMLGWTTAAFGFGNAAGPLLAGYVGGHFGLHYSFLLAALIMAPMVWAAAGLAAPTPASRPAFVPMQLGASLRQPLMYWSLLLTLLVWVGFDVRTTFLPLFLAAKGLPPQRIGEIVTLSYVTGILSRPFLGRISQRLGLGRLLLGAVSLGAAGFLLFPLAAGWSVYMLAALMVSLAWDFCLPTTVTLVTYAAPAGGLGVALGIRMLAVRLGQYLSPALYGVVAARFGVLQTLFVAVVVLAAAMGGATAAIRAYVGRSLAPVRGD